MSLVSEQAILQLEAVGFTYPADGLGISGLSFSVGQGEFVGILGANGSGKSTILKLACGILKPQAGAVSLWNRPLHHYDHKDRAKLISYLPQQIDISVPFTVRELVGMGLYPYDIPPLMTIDEAIAITGLSDKADARLTDLSGGERRRTFIAMTLVQGAGLLLLDEPLANLDIKYQVELINLLKNLRSQKNISIFMALHDIDVALQFDTVILIKDGVIIGTGRPADVLTPSLLDEAFGMDITVRRFSDGGVYMKYERPDIQAPAAVGSTEPSYRFFQNRECQYFPCHPVDPSLLNCLFCFCPLYYALCPGEPKYFESNGGVVKDCSDCDYPHRPGSYDTILAELRKNAAARANGTED